ncbi:MAG: hypothetical protein AABY83_11760 [Pseudomonadota bacterium]
MKRRTLIKAIGLGSLGFGFRSSYGLQLNNIKFSARMSGVDLSSTPIPFNNFPRVINIFLYGGPSELAGNLSNIVDINGSSLNKYDAPLLQSTAQGGQITPNGFWKNAGGDAMETMLQSGVMTVYRTMSRTRSHDLKAHRESVLQNQLGSFDMDRSGIGTTLSELILAHSENTTFGKPISNLLFPFVSFDSQAQWFNPGDVQIDSALRPTALGRDLGANNPYTRNGIAPTTAIDGALENLAKTINVSSGGPASPIRNAFAARENIATSLRRFSTQGITTHITDLNAGAALTYPADGFGPVLKSAVSLMLMNPDTLYAAVGGGAMGGWDDHNGALANGRTDYILRTKNLMDAIMAAMVHMRAAKSTGNSSYLHADSIIINVYGDFGRNVDLNNSGGWDHGNNQNLYTFGGRDFRASALGKIVGRTDLLFTDMGKRIFTKPMADSYQFEPFSLASTLYKYYGVANPGALNGGVPAIDETQSSVAQQSWTPTSGSIYETVSNYLTT